jgi:H2-forming N5,N10-methylenetetrahydromethanopterin dehydrogenase-like enzyme
MQAMVAVIDDAGVDAVAKALVAEKLLNRLEGMPTQMTVTADVGDVSNLTPEQREAEMAEIQRKLALG